MARPLRRLIPFSIVILTFLNQSLHRDTYHIHFLISVLDLFTSHLHDSSNRPENPEFGVICYCREDHLRDVSFRVLYRTTTTSHDHLLAVLFVLGS